VRLIEVSLCGLFIKKTEEKEMLVYGLYDRSKDKTAISKKGLHVYRQPVWRQHLSKAMGDRASAVMC